MFQNKTKVFICTVCWITCLCIVLGLKTEPKTIGLANTVTVFREGAAEFSRASLELKAAVAALNGRDTTTFFKARMALKNSRMRYKKIEFFMDYFFESESMVYNKPAKVEVEEPYMEYQQPSGFQVMETMLFDADPVSHQKELIAQAELVSSSAADLNSLLYGFEGNDKEVLESVRLELLRVITLSITGYDAPELKTGIEESYVSVEAISKVLHPYLALQSMGSDSLALNITRTLKYLKDHPDFDSFDRMYFLTQYALPIQEQLGEFIRLKKLDLNSKTSLNYQAKNIFSKDAVSSDAFPGSKESSPAVVALGKKLFTEKNLSGNLQRSCSSCHRPEAYFTDGLKTSLAFDGKSYVQRNAPSLLYAGFQYAQFWDGRAKSLQEQIKTVISNPLEMNGDHAVILERLKKDTVYLRNFQRAFPASGINTETLSDALAAYVKGLAPMNSAFDNYIAGDKKAMSAEQVKGFNLFMGKGQCGSCHFAPLFNGLIPPFYKRTEYEILGTPENDDFDHLKADKDKGRSGFFPISYYEAAFKTPTVRNTEKTAPYMHNGVFKDLDKVVEFYNHGGGAGLHLDLPQQTLSSKPLHLSKEETHQIVVFMQSLTDKPE